MSEPTVRLSSADASIAPDRTRTQALATHSRSHAGVDEGCRPGGSTEAAGRRSSAQVEATKEVKAAPTVAPAEDVSVDLARSRAQVDASLLRVRWSMLALLNSACVMLEFAYRYPGECERILERVERRRATRHPGLSSGRPCNGVNSVDQRGSETAVKSKQRGGLRKSA